MKYIVIFIVLLTLITAEANSFFYVESFTTENKKAEISNSWENFLEFFNINNIIEIISEYIDLDNIIKSIRIIFKNKFIQKIINFAQNTWFILVKISYNYQNFLEQSEYSGCEIINLSTLMEVLLLIAIISFSSH